MSALRIDPAEFRRGWRVIALALIGVATSASVLPLYGFGALVVPLQEALGWERRDILATASFLSFGAIFSSQIVGWMNRIHGMKTVTVISLILLPLVFVLMSQIDRVGGSIWLLYGCFVLATFAGMGTLQVTWTHLVNQWFERNRGLALAMILSGSGVAGLTLPPLITAVVEQWNWRAGFLLLALLPLLITLPLCLRWFVPLPRPGAHDTHTADAGAPMPGADFRDGVRSRRYWTINLSMVLVSSAIIVMVINTVPLLRDKGFSATDAGRMFSFFGIALVFGRVMVGYLVDRFWAPGVACVALAMPALGCLLLAMATVDTHASYLIVGIMLIGVGAGAEFDLAAFLIASYFGMRDYGRLFGLQAGVISGGICIAPAAAALLYDIAGDYSIVLRLNVALSLASAAALLTLGPYPHFPAHVTSKMAAA